MISFDLSERAQEMRRRQHEYNSTASSWPEAFQKNIARMEHELASDTSFNNSLQEGEEPLPTEFWQRGIDATKRAAALHEAGETSMDVIADVIDKEFPSNYITDMLRSDDPEMLLNW